MAENVVLDGVERRVLGVLMEKALCQPDYYPMTLNALVAGCNQRQNRDPVMSLDADTVFDALERLRGRGLATLVFPAPGARTNRFKHEADAVFHWQPRERAVMAELLLRGPQTMGELRTHCSRMMPFADLEAVSMVVQCLQRGDQPMVAVLPREPGRSAVRYTHLLEGSSGHLEKPGADEIEATPPGGSSANGGSSGIPTGATSDGDDVIALLESRVEELEQRIATLERRADPGDGEAGSDTSGH